jgi:orotate phosphoribosyltransferase
VTTLKRTLDLAARRAVAARTEEVLRDAGAVRAAHMALPDGRHATELIDAVRLLADPVATGELCGYLAAPHRHEDGTAAVDVVVGPPGPGAVLAVETARRLRVLAATSESVVDALAGEGRALLVDLELAHDGALLAAIPHVEAGGAELVGCAVVLDRTDGRAQVTSAVTWATYPFAALWRPDRPTFAPGPETCPACAAGQPLDAGSA